MGKRGRLPVSLDIVISTSIRPLFLRPGVLVCNSGYGVCRILVVVVVRNIIICVDSIVDIVLRKSRIV